MGQWAGPFSPWPAWVGLGYKNVGPQLKWAGPTQPEIVVAHNGLARMGRASPN